MASPMCAWTFNTGSAASVTEGQMGRFASDQAYVVQAPPEAEGGQARLFLWAGDDASKELKTCAAKHAGELVKTLDASYLRQTQGAEGAEFKQLFASFEIVQAEAAAPPPPAAAPVSATTTTEEEETGGEEDEGEGKGDAAAPATGKKKRKNKKKKGGQGQQQQQEGGGAAAPAAPAAPAAAAAPASPAKPPSPVPKTPLSPTSALHAEAKPFSPMLHAEAKPFSPVGAVASPPAASPPAASPAPASAAKEPTPAAASPAPAAAAPTPSPAKQPSPAAATPAKEATPAAKEPTPSPAKQPTPAAATPAKEVTPSPAKQPTPAPASAAKAATPAAATPASVARAQGVVEEGSSPSVSAAKEQLLKKLSGTFADPLAQQRAPKEGGKAKGTYLADSAKAWGGVPDGSAAAPPAPVEAKIKPGQQMFAFEELKGMRVESGIDMARKEAYLSEEDFAKVFGKSRADWVAQPAWRQQLAKKQVGLW